MLEINMELLKKATRDFYKISKLKIVLFDTNRTVLYSYPETMFDFCEHVRKSDILADRCCDCDKRGFDICDETKKITIYKCHMGLSEAISPICENGVVIGYMMLGQMLDINNKEYVLDNLLKIADKYNLDKKKMQKAWSELFVIDYDSILSAASMMEMCICFLWHKNIIEIKNESLVYHLNTYICEHLSESLSIFTLCEHLNISRSNLYSLSKNNFGTGISDYIRNKRIEKAVELLKEGKLRIGEIAILTGLSDPNYFTKIIKKHTGKTPSQLKNSR